MSTHFQEWFYVIPITKQYEILDEIAKALKWKGWDTLPSTKGEHAHRAMKNIAKIAEANGLVLEEYT